MNLNNGAQFNKFYWMEGQGTQVAESQCFIMAKLNSALIVS